MSERRSIALFPGGFKPAHRDHLQAITDLCARPDIDEVRVIVSDRARLLPGTHMALGGRDCADALRYLLAVHPPSKPVSVHLAPHKAIDHAYAMVDSAPSGGTLWFCVGQADAENGDGRFQDLNSHPCAARLKLNVTVLPSSSQPVHATELRALLAGGCHREAPASLLPASLTSESSARYWMMLQKAVQPMAGLLLPKIARLLQQSLPSEGQALSIIDPEAIDPEFRWLNGTGDVYRVLYSGDTVAEGSFVEPGQPLPARRIAVQARVLRHLNRFEVPRSWQVARVHHWDKRHRLLVLTELPGRRLDAALLKEMPASDALRIFEAAAAFLAAFHGTKVIEEPLWGGQEEEQFHWQLCTEVISRSPSGRALLKPRASPLHLNFSPAVLHYHEPGLFVGGFERAACYGDPAWDLASFVRACWAEQFAPSLIDRFLATYKRDCTAAGLLKDDPMRCRRALEIAAQTQ